MALPYLNNVKVFALLIGFLGLLQLKAHAEDVSVKATVEPSQWSVRDGASQTIKIEVTLLNNTDAAKNISLYFPPQFRLEKGHVISGSQMGSDNALPITSADIITLEPNKSYLKTFIATLTRKGQDYSLKCDGMNNGFSSVTFAGGDYRFKLVIESRIPSFIKSKLSSKAAHSVWQGQLTSNEVAISTGPL